MPDESQGISLYRVLHRGGIGEYGTYATVVQ
jgi:hypothetical protein